MNFVDAPLFVTLVLATLLVRQPRRARTFGLAAPVAAFLALCVVSVLTNIGRVDPAPALMFVYGFLGPFVVFWAVHRIWPTGRALTFSRLLVGLGIVQLVAVATLNLPEFMSNGNNPDVISGTFGENPYQLVFFLLVLIALLAGITTFERDRLVARFVPALVVASFAVIFLAQYRAILVTAGLTVLGLGFVLSIGRARGFVLTLVAIVGVVLSLSYMSHAFPRLKFADTIAEFTNDPTYYATERLKILDDTWNLYGDNGALRDHRDRTGDVLEPRLGDVLRRSQKRTNTAGVLASRLLGGGSYNTDVSQKYVIPRLQRVISGSHAVTSPQASWPTLLGEVGVPGVVLITIAYGLLFVAVLKRAAISLRTRVRGDPIPALLLAAGTALFVLVQMGSLENWLEVTRVTFLTATITAIAIKEFDAAHGDAA